MAVIYSLISIPLGLLFMAPFVLGMGEQYFGSIDRSVGAMGLPLILFVFFISAVIGAFLFTSGMYLLSPALRKILLTVILVSITLIGGVTYFSWARGNINEVVGSAEKIAGDEPYCIDVPSASGIKEAGWLGEFSGYLRLSPGGWGGYAGPRPVLAVGDGVQPEVYHWSFYQKSFVKDDGRLTPVHCRPSRHFVLALSNQRRVAQQVDGVRYAGMYLSIPQIYRGGAISYQSSPTIIFFATAPLFESTPDAGQPDAIFSHIEVNFAETDRTDAWLTKNSSDYRVVDNGEKYGLRWQTSWHAGPGGVISGRPSYQYFDISPDKKVITVITCPADEAGGYCLHAFRRGGWTYTFHHRAVDLPKWQGMQEKLAHLARSFVTVGSMMQDGNK